MIDVLSSGLFVQLVAPERTYIRHDMVQLLVSGVCVNPLPCMQSCLAKERLCLLQMFHL